MKYLIHALIATLLYACQTTPGKKDMFRNEIRVDLDRATVSYSDLIKSIDSIQLIPLATNDNFLIGQIKKMHEREYHFFIQDATSPCIFIYDKRGNGIAKLSRKGRGPGEYIDIADFTVQDGKIIILDGSGEKLLQYDCSGKFIHEIPITSDLMYDKVGRVDAQRLLLLSNDSDSATVSLLNTVSKQTELLTYLSRAQGNSSSFSAENILSEQDNHVLYKTLFDYNFYKITGDSILPEYRFDFGKYNYPTDIRDSKTIVNEMARGNHVVFMDMVHENNRYLYFTFLFRGKFHESYFNKSTGQYRVFRNLTDEEVSQFPFHDPLYARDNHFVLTVTPSSVPSLVRLCEEHHVPIRYEQAASSSPVHEDGNPILLLMYLN